jgi:toxin secretion/phage lysis holin
MSNLETAINIGFGGIGGFLGWLFGGLDGFLYALIVFVIADYFTGVLAAGVQKKLSSNVGFTGIAKKLTIFILVAIANIIDTHIIKTGSAVKLSVVFFYISNEGISIIENAVIIGLPVPKKLKDVLLQISKEESNNGDN